MTSAIHIDNLRVANWQKARADDSMSPRSLEHFEQRGLLLDTCLRQLFIAVEPREDSAGIQPTETSHSPELYFGIDAYRYVLEVATGLRSAVPGETNIFGQFRKAWEHYRNTGNAPPVVRLTPWMHRWMNDARVIRRNFLQGIGGASYGRLVRRLIAPGRDEHVLFVGAGDLAGSMLPYFDDFEVGIWNHRPIGSGHASASRQFAPERAPEAAAWADHVIFTTPPDQRHDSAWKVMLRNAEVRTLVHLGHRRGDLTAWPVCATTYDLDDVFELRQEQADVRSHQLARARLACLDAARARVNRPEPSPLCGLAPA